MSAQTVWRRRQLSQSCDLQRAHLHALVTIHRRQLDSTVNRVSRLTDLSVHVWQLYRSWRQPSTTSKAGMATDAAAVLVEAALSAVDYWRSSKKR